MNKHSITGDTNYKLTEEQIECIEAINDESIAIVAIEANSGASKSSTVCFSLEKPYNTNINSVLVLSFNNKIAKENKKAFPQWADVMTIHSLAYKTNNAKY